MTNEEFIEKISLDGEIWKDVVGYEGWYIVSNKSRIASLPIGYKRGRVLKTPLSSHGYPCVCLTKNRVRTKIVLHRIVAMAWIPNPNNYPCIDHIDGCRTNDSISNLRWVTYSMNINNPITKQRMSETKRGDLRYGAYRCIPIVLITPTGTIKKYRSIASVKADGFAPTTVKRYLNGERKTTCGSKWMYLSDYENLNTNDVKEL